MTKGPATRIEHTPAQPASEAEAKALGIPTAPNPGAPITPITDEEVERYPVAKGERVLIGGQTYIAQSDEGVTVRRFKHNDGSPTSVVIIDAPTKEAVAWAGHLVETGQMLSEDEVRTLRTRGLVKEHEGIDPVKHRALLRKLGLTKIKTPGVRRDQLSQAAREAMWREHQAKMANRIEQLEAQLRAAGLEPTEEDRARAKIQERVIDEEVDVVKAGTK